MQWIDQLEANATRLVIVPRIQDYWTAAEKARVVGQTIGIFSGTGFRNLLQFCASQMKMPDFLMDATAGFDPAALTAWSHTK